MAAAADVPLTWLRVEHALGNAAGWRRRGVEWHGPCPLTGRGRDTAWFRPGAVVEVLAGCRKCGGRLAGALFWRHVEAVLGVPAAAATVVASRPGPAAVPSPAIECAWRTSVPVRAVSPAWTYLSATRGVVLDLGQLPAAVRWLPAIAAQRAQLFPRLPAGARGAVVYRFAGPGESGTAALQLEALGDDGRRLPLTPPDELPPRYRVSAFGALFGAGRRVFVATAGRPRAGCWLVEGPLDALGVVRLAAAGIIDLGGAAVFGVAGAPAGFQLRACWNDGPVTLAADRDQAGRDAMVRLGAQLRDADRGYRVCLPPPRMDWAALASRLAEPVPLPGFRFLRDAGSPFLPRGRLAAFVARL